MLEPEKSRISAEEALQHPFIRDNQAEKLRLRQESCFNYIQNVQNFRDYSQLKKIILTSIATRLNFSEIRRLHDIFIELDRDCDGTIGQEEFEAGIKRFLTETGISGIDTNSLFNSIDKNDSQRIVYSEFIAAFMNHTIFEDRKKLLEIFEYYDVNKEGKIDFKEFEKILFLPNIPNNNSTHDFFPETKSERFFIRPNSGENLASLDKESQSHLREVFKKEFDYYDTNKDGKINYDEFVEIVLKRDSEKHILATARDELKLESKSSITAASGATGANIATKDTKKLKKRET